MSRTIDLNADLETAIVRRMRDLFDPHVGREVVVHDYFSAAFAVPYRGELKRRDVGNDSNYFVRSPNGMIFLEPRAKYVIDDDDTVVIEMARWSSQEGIDGAFEKALEPYQDE